MLSLLGFLLNVVQQAHQNSVGGHQSQCVYDGPVTDAVVFGRYLEKKCYGS